MGVLFLRSLNFLLKFETFVKPEAIEISKTDKSEALLNNLQACSILISVRNCTNVLLVLSLKYLQNAFGVKLARFAI